MVAWQAQGGARGLSAERIHVSTSSFGGDLRTEEGQFPTGKL